MSGSLMDKFYIEMFSNYILPSYNKAYILAMAKRIDFNYHLLMNCKVSSIAMLLHNSALSKMTLAVSQCDKAI